MGFRIQKRLGKQVGLNISKSGVAPSVRTRFGSVGTKGFTVRTGIPGVSYRSGKKLPLWGVLVLAAVVWGYQAYMAPPQPRTPVAQATAAPTPVPPVTP